MEHEHKKHPHAGHGFTHTHVEHHADGSHTVHHVHEDGPHKDVKSAVGDHDGMMDSMMSNTSAPNPGEAEANAGPTPAAAPGAPAGPVAPPSPMMGS